MEKLRIGVIGCGVLGNGHIGQYSKMQEVEIACVADIDEKFAQETKEKYRVKDYAVDYDKLIMRDDIDIIDVCLPTYLHADAVVKAASAGKHIFCEKPIAMTLEEADRMIEACEKAGVKFTIGLCRRFDNEWLKFKELINDNVIGRPVIWRQMSAFGDAGSSWYLDRKKGGGPFLDAGIHSFDFAQFIFGEFDSVFADTRTFRKDITASDTGTVIVRFKSGDELLLSWSWGLPPGCPGTNLEDAIGPGGIIIFPSTSDPTFLDSSKPGVFTINKSREEKKTELYEKNDMWFDEIEHFIGCVRNDAEPKVSGTEAKKSLEIGLAVLECTRKFK